MTGAALRRSSMNSASYSSQECPDVLPESCLVGRRGANGATKVPATLLDGSGEFMQQCVGLRPVDAGIGDALSIDKRLAVYETLRSSNEIAFNHGTDDAVFPVRDLF